MHILRTSLIALLLLTAFIPAAQAQGLQIIDYVGYGWETGGFPSINPGDELIFVANASALDAIVGVDLGVEEVTFYIHDLIVAGGSVDGNGTTSTMYSGGVLEVYRDAAKNADYGVFPPNPTAPSTFMDGTLLLQGNFTSFTVLVASDGSGFFGGPADGVAGELITACTGCIYTWGGSFSPPSGAQIIEGYQFQMDGILEVDPVVPTQDERAWGALKATYGNHN
jgi:hypothetical protein